MIRIETTDIPELDIYKGNKEVRLLRYYEPEPGIFIAESRNVILRALAAGYEPISAVIQIDKADDPKFLEQLGDVPVYVGEQELLKEITGIHLIGGYLCAMRRKKPADLTQVLQNARRVAVMEGVVNPTNVGAIFRSAAALGMDAVILSPACADPLYRRAIRVSVGNVFLIPWTFLCRSEEEWIEKGVSMLKAFGFATAAMALREDNVTIDAKCLKQEEKLALIVGNEGDGLNEKTIEACDYVAKIPMAAGVDSLNVSVAAALAFWELGNKGR